MLWVLRDSRPHEFVFLREVKQWCVSRAPGTVVLAWWERPEVSRPENRRAPHVAQEKQSYALRL
jgi:hypothetical protein